MEMGECVQKTGGEMVDTQLKVFSNEDSKLSVKTGRKQTLHT